MALKYRRLWEPDTVKSNYLSDYISAVTSPHQICPITVPKGRQMNFYQMARCTPQWFDGDRELTISCLITGHPPPPSFCVHTCTQNSADAAAVVWMGRMRVTYGKTGMMSALPSGVYISAASQSGLFLCKHWVLGSFCHDLSPRFLFVMISINPHSYSFSGRKKSSADLS